MVPRPEVKEALVVTWLEPAYVAESGISKDKGEYRVFSGVVQTERGPIQQVKVVLVVNKADQKRVENMIQGSD